MSLLFAEKKRKRSYSGSSSSSSSSSSDSEEEKEKEKEKIVKPDDSIPQEIIEDKVEKPRSLHKTTSIFLRNLAPTITRQEIEAMCSR